MNRKTIAAVGTLGWAGYRLWQKRPILERARAELDETGRIRFETLAELGLAALGAAVLVSQMLAAFRTISR
jgi:hypothetical protein